jgi:hypothetical protein
MKACLDALGIITTAWASLSKTVGIFRFGIAVISLIALVALTILSAPSLAEVGAMVVLVVSALAVLVLVVSSFAKALEYDMQKARIVTTTTRKDFMFFITMASPYSELQPTGQPAAGVILT